MNNEQIVARKYAKAFLNLYIKEISLEHYNAIKNIENFFRNHKTVLFFLSIPTISATEKEKNLYELLKKFDLTLLKPLIKLLVTQKRIFLIDDVLTQILLLYKEIKNIMLFNIMSPHQLDKSDIKAIEEFLAEKTGKIITSEHRLDKKINCRATIAK